MRCVHQYERCEDAIEALVAGERPDVMLFDIGLPGMSGIEGIRRIKTALPEIEILVFSVFDDNEKVFNAICADFSVTANVPSSDSWAADKSSSRP
jgi:DNA-binding NarL/FixJ family response regulator